MTVYPTHPLLPTEPLPTNPASYIPIGIAVALMISGFLWFVNPRSPMKTLLSMIWMVGVIAYIPAATSLVLTSEFYQAQVNVFVAALVMFVAGMLYREATWCIWIIFARMLPTAVSDIYEQLCKVDMRYRWRTRWLAIGITWSIGLGLFTAVVTPFINPWVMVGFGAVGYFIVSSILWRLAYGSPRL